MTLEQFFHEAVRNSRYRGYPAQDKAKFHQWAHWIYRNIGVRR